MSWRPSVEQRRAAGVAAAAAGLFSVTFSGRVAAGDAPESVAGVASFGILHAPGYPAYVLAAKVFSTLVPVGSLAFRVNLFSLVCATATVVGVYLVARKLGASAPAAAIGALTLATGTSFWFYAGFAKHYAFSAALVIGATFLVMTWRERGGLAAIAGAGALLGLCAGASWQLAALAGVALAYLVLAPGTKGRRARAAIAATAAAAIVVVALGGLVITRAKANPDVNWGAPTNVARIVDLLTLKDFGFGTGAVQRRDESSGKSVGSGDVAQLPARLAAYAVVTSREVGLLAIALAVAGAATALAPKTTVTKRRRTRTWPKPEPVYVAIALAVNIVAAAIVVGFTGVDGFTTGLVQGGFLVGFFIALALFVALGADAVIERAPEQVGARPAAVAIAVLVLLPAVVVHYRPADHRPRNRVVDAHAKTVFAALPPKAVLLSWGAERAFPLQYAQTVDHRRPDVVLITADQLGLDWYRRQASERLHVDLGPPPPQGTPPQQAAAAFAAQWRTGHPDRPLYLDGAAMPSLITAIGYRPQGIVGEVVDGTGVHPPTSVEALERTVAAQRRQAGMTKVDRSFPNEFVVQSYVVAELELATAAFNAKDLATAERHLTEALGLDPGNSGIRQNLQKVRQQQNSAGHG
jgi:4-amino-4-deoxy-L-arabinose transferase-like glycosyltransferase